MTLFFTIGICTGLILTISIASAHSARVSLSHLVGPLWVVEDTYYAKENSIVYLGPEGVTVVGATWTPGTAKLLAGEIAKVTSAPITEVINTNYHPDRAGGNAYWKSIGAKVISTRMTYELLKRDWTDVVEWTRRAIPDYPESPLVLPTVTYPGNFELQKGRVKAFYLGPSHTQGDMLVYVPDAKTLYSGDILFIGSTPVMWAGPVGNWLAALDRILEWGFFSANLVSISPKPRPVTILVVTRYSTRGSRYSNYIICTC